MDFTSSLTAINCAKKRSHLSNDIQLKNEEIKNNIINGEINKLILNLFEFIEYSNIYDEENDILPWEPLSISILIFIELLNHKLKNEIKNNIINFNSFELDEISYNKLLNILSLNMEHEEPRVRKMIAKLLGILSEKYGTTIFEYFKNQLIISIEENFERSENENNNNNENENENKSENEKLIEMKYELMKNVDINESIDLNEVRNFRSSSPLPGRPDSPSLARVLDDTSGWRSLETSFYALESIINGCPNSSFLLGNYLNDELIYLIINGATIHINRHVREVCFNIINSIFLSASNNHDDNIYYFTNDMLDKLIDSLGKGLQDNWSQIRYASSIAVRTYFLNFLKSKSGENISKEKYFSLLLPRMCLNRYYGAEGVRILAQRTWSEVMGDKGREYVSNYLNDVVQYYIERSDADNHVVREAACYAVAELAMKIDKNYLYNYIDQLINSLLICFNDESWPVRDSACVATGRFVKKFPNESINYLDLLYEKWFRHLIDPIWSVREDTAITLIHVIEGYGEEAENKIINEINKLLPMANEQPRLTEEEKKLRFNDPSLHTGHQVYSCGSLGPKLRKGGCSDCVVLRGAEPWEKSDGAIYFIRELCSISPDKAISYFPQIVELARLNHFTEADNLRTTIFKSLPIMAEKLTKKIFKRHLNQFLPSLFHTINNTTSSQLARHAAAECIEFLSKFIGNRIFYGRLEDWMKDIYDNNSLIKKDLQNNNIDKSSFFDQEFTNYELKFPK